MQLTKGLQNALDIVCWAITFLVIFDRLPWWSMFAIVAYALLTGR